MNEQKGVESIVASSRNSLLAERCLWLSTTFAQRCEDSLQAQLDARTTVSRIFEWLLMIIDSEIQHEKSIRWFSITFGFPSRSFDEDRYWRSALCLMRLGHRKAELSFKNRLEWMNIEHHHRLTFELCAAPRKPWSFDVKIWINFQL